LDNINLNIKEGELVVLKGVSGSGKSTVLSLIASLTKPTTGEVIVDGQRVSKLPDNFASDYRQRSIGFIFQKYNLIPTLSVEENILLPLVPTNPNEDEARAKLDRVMEIFDIVDKKSTMVRNLSGGEQQRVAIARAIINDPKIVIADEPTANLDEKLSLDFIEMLRGLKSSGKTIVVATHDPLFFELDMVDRIVEMKSGKIL
ncbi:MAG TPA: ABC transporter ATP-binding protein, partial [Sulfurovum sp.]|nr:ABC transporter ATP-binding protein [Sulfurovum sp.]